MKHIRSYEPAQFSAYPVGYVSQTYGVCSSFESIDHYKVLGVTLTF